MPATPFVETEALLALMTGDEDEALRLIDEEMMPGERRAFVEHLDRLSEMADDRLRCRGCNKPADHRAGTTIRSLVGGPFEHWHTDCLNAQKPV